MAETVTNITEATSVDVDLLREQRNTLLEILEVLCNSRRDDVEDFFAFDREDAAEKVEGVINLLDNLLDDAECYIEISNQ